MKYSLFDTPALTGRYLPRVLKSRWLTTGPECERLKVALGQQFKIAPERVVLGSSATALWQAVLDVLRPRKTHVTSWTWPGIKNAWGEYADPRSESLALVTHLGGAAPVPNDPCETFKAQCRALDACHSWLPMTPGYDSSFTSFYPTKLVPGAEGGALFLHTNKIKAEDIEAAINCGQLPAHKRGTATLTERFGRKGAMTDVQAALNREALTLHEGYVDRVLVGWSRMVMAAYEAKVEFRVQHVRPYLFQVDCPPARAPLVRRRLAKQGIPTAWNFPPAGLITIPAHDALSGRDCRRIMRTVKECLK